MMEKKKISRIIPFGYEKVNGKDLLRPIKDQLKHLNTAKNLYKDGNTSLRRVSQWLTDNTGRYLSHVRLRTIINKQKLNTNKANINIKLQNNWQGIFGLNHARIGDVVEHIAITRLLKSGWEVFKNISSVGPIDICIFNIKKNKFYYIDIKSLTRSYRSIEHFLSGMCVERLTSKQKKLGVKLAYYFDDRVYIIINRKAKQVICI